MAYEREAQTDLAELNRLAASLTETDPPSGYERDAQTDVVELGRLTRDLSETNPASGGYERVGQTNIAVLRRKLLGGVVVPPVATGYSLSGPSSGNVPVASTNFTVALTPLGGTVVGTATITPSDGGGGGTFTPTTVGLTTASPSATFTYTAASAGTKTISTTNDKSLTNPTSLSYAATAVGLADGDPVTSWTDSSGNGNHATQTGSARPTFKTAIVNGKPTVRFTVAGSSGLNLSPALSSADPFSLFAVMKPVDAVAGMFTLAPTTEGTPLPILIGGSGGVLYAWSRAGYVPSVVRPTAAFHVFTTTAGAGLVFGYTDGTSTPSGGGVPAASAGNWTGLGWRPFDSQSGDGDIAELILYNTKVSDTDRANIEKYLGTKYGITVAGGTAVSPDSVSGLVGWWKADSLLPPVAALADGDPVSLWPDSNFRGHDATQTGSARPIFKTAILNGKPVVRFTSAAFSSLNLATSITGTNPFEMYTVMKPATAAQNIISLASSTSNQAFGISEFGALDFLIGGTKSAIGYLTPNPYDDAFHIFGFAIDGSATGMQIDGTVIGPTFGASAGTGDFNVIGSRNVTDYSDGDLAEAFIYDHVLGIAGANRNGLIQYLLDKYGITPGGGWSPTTAKQPDTVTGLLGWWKADSL